MTADEHLRVKATSPKSNHSSSSWILVKVVSRLCTGHKQEHLLMNPGAWRSVYSWLRVRQMEDRFGFMECGL